MPVTSCERRGLSSETSVVRLENLIFLLTFSRKTAGSISTARKRESAWETTRQHLLIYKKSLSCSKPKLAAFKREYAETKIRELGL